MRLLHHLEKRFGAYAIPNVTLYLAFGQLCCLLLIVARPGVEERIMLIPSLVAAGEWWRIVTFVFFPLFGGNPVFAVFGLLFFCFIGTTLENHWGAFRLNLFLLVGYVATVLASLVQPEEPVSNTFVNGSMFLGFAILYPEYVIYVFFVLPVKVKWLAALQFGGYVAAMCVGGWSTRAVVAASLANVVLFFRREIVESYRGFVRQTRQSSRRSKARDEAAAVADVPFHVCAVCGITDRTHPRMEFRYCADCVGGVGYCTEHIRQHQHRTAR